jgi:hypothetical protein
VSDASQSTTGSSPIGSFGYPERTVEIELVRLVEDFAFYPRFTVDEHHVLRLAEAIRAGVRLPPVVGDAKSLRIADGFHRRRAYLKVMGETAVAPVRLIEFPNEAALFAFTAVNAQHGKPLSTGEMVRFVLRAEELGLSRVAIADCLGVTRERIDGWLERKTALDPSKLTRVVIKPVFQHLAGETLTVEQVAVNRTAGGYRAAYYARLLADLIEADGIDTANTILMERLRRLHAVLTAFLERTLAAQAEAGATPP